MPQTFPEGRFDRIRPQRVVGAGSVGRVSMAVTGGTSSTRLQAAA